MEISNQDNNLEQDCEGALPAIILLETEKLLDKAKKINLKSIEMVDKFIGSLSELTRLINDSIILKHINVNGIKK